MLGAAAAATIRHLAREVGLNPAVYLKHSLSPALLSVDIEAQPDQLRQLALGHLQALGALSPAAAAKALNARFSCLEPVSVRRDWLRRRARLQLTLREAAAVAYAKGRPAGYLSRDGVVFEAPAGLYEVAGPRVDVGAAASEDLAAAAKLLDRARRPDALSSPLKSLRFVSPQDGWELALADGTLVQWGDGRWTTDKLTRLRSVLDDARREQAGAALYMADLRYFEDGKVLLRPLPSRSYSMR